MDGECMIHLQCKKKLFFNYNYILKQLLIKAVVA